MMRRGRSGRRRRKQLRVHARDGVPDGWGRRVRAVVVGVSQDGQIGGEDGGGGGSVGDEAAHERSAGERVCGGRAVSGGGGSG
jgi:hypothetical protein